MTDWVDARELMLRSMQGANLRGLQQPAVGVWEFDFEKAGLTISCPWRIVSAGVVVLGASDHGQKFGLPAPVDVISETLAKLGSKIVESVEIGAETGDLCIRFSGNARIEAFNNSGGYEGWNYADRAGVMVVGMGGGSLAIWSKLPKR
jgi:hypothetical protein